MRELARLFDAARRVASHFHAEDYIASAHTSFLPLWTLAVQQARGGTVFAVLPSDETAYAFYKELAFFDRALTGDAGSAAAPEDISGDAAGELHGVTLIPSWGCAPGSPLAQYAPRRMERARALYGLAAHPKKIIVCSVRSWIDPVPPPDFLRAAAIEIRKGGEADHQALAEKLLAYNFLPVPQVSGAGEYATRGAVLDIGMSEGMYRVAFDFGCVENISFRAWESSEHVALADNASFLFHPCSEHAWSADSVPARIKTLAARYPEISSRLIASCEEKLISRGWDEHDYLYGSLSFEQLFTLADYCPQKERAKKQVEKQAPKKQAAEKSPEKNLVMLCDFRLSDANRRRYKEECVRAYLDGFHIRCMPRPELWFEFVEGREKDMRVSRVIHETIDGAHAVGDTPAASFSGNVRFFEKQALEHLKQPENEVVVFASDDAQRARMETLLDSALLEHKNFSLAACPVARGFALSLNSASAGGNALVFSDADVLGKKLFAMRHAGQSVFIDDIASIEIGDLVVHAEYGIGRFKGLARMSVQGCEKDFMHLMYRGGEALYVPIEQMNLVQKYIGGASVSDDEEQTSMKLDAIGGAAWASRKQKAQAAAEDISGMLLSLHAERSVLPGFAFPAAGEIEQAFIERFPFAETADQLKAWDEIEADMRRAHPMDRLVVGDVGFGKTELAFRAAFKAVSAGKQVAFLVPTTILAEQHYLRAQERFEGFPVSIAMLSRFVSPAEQKRVLADAANGGAEIVIGTHRILQRDVSFANLGLIIVDEEHRFGVKDKERIKKFKSTVDCLALSATPIPRTLQQSLISVRSMSLLTTPPRQRKPIKTAVEPYGDETVQEAVRREISRGGQVFFLHNRISSLENVAQYIRALVPEATVLAINGQMPAAELEDAMHRFVHGGANVLVSTTIIENGIDIPNVNTIIIDRADMYGISQLYQLRGRVGRGDRTAYAYLLYPDENRITDLALKRLTAISDYSELGAGFQVAMKDLEVRGAGNLLGREQSGTIFSVGYEYYMQLLEKAMRQRAREQEIREKGAKKDADELSSEPAPEPLLELQYTGFIPSHYVSDIGVKMDIYKSIARISTREMYDEVRAELSKKYGPIPLEIQRLFLIAKIKILARMMRISAVRDRGGALELHFSRMSLVEKDAAVHANVARLIAAGQLTVHPTRPHVLSIPCAKVMTLEEKHEILEKRLREITGASE